MPFSFHYPLPGTGTGGSNNDGGPATLAQLGQNPMGCAADMGGNIFVADYNNHAIRQLAPNPLISGSYVMTTVSLATLTPALLSLPTYNPLVCIVLTVINENHPDIPT